MGGRYVKNTIVEAVLHYVAPHPCSGCGKIGSLLCHYCKYDIVSEPFSGCFVCGVSDLLGICAEHGIPAENARIVSTYTSALKALLYSLKFKYAKAASKTAAELLNDALPKYPRNAVVVSVPTLYSHIRQRGFDHVGLIAKQFAALRGLEYKALLTRTNKATQHHLGREDRMNEAKQAFAYTATAQHQNAPILLIDDIITTGSTIREAANTLRTQHQTIFIAALAYHPLD